jgi:cytosine deaminase
MAPSRARCPPWRRRAARWNAADVRAHELRAESAYAHGTGAIRTHLDSIRPQDAISWPVFAELRADWKGRIDLQAVMPCRRDGVQADGQGAYRAMRRPGGQPAACSAWSPIPPRS